MKITEGIILTSCETMSILAENLLKVFCVFSPSDSKKHILALQKKFDIKEENLEAVSNLSTRESVEIVSSTIKALNKMASKEGLKLSAMGGGEYRFVKG
jgi:hypothetical protein